MQAYPCEILWAVGALTPFAIQDFEIRVFGSVTIKINADIGEMSNIIFQFLIPENLHNLTRVRKPE